MEENNYCYSVPDFREGKNIFDLDYSIQLGMDTCFRGLSIEWRPKHIKIDQYAFMLGWLSWYYGCKKKNTTIGDGFADVSRIIGKKIEADKDIFSHIADMRKYKCLE